MERLVSKNRTPFRIVVVHYHLFPGGVTTSIRNSLDSLVRAGEMEGRDVLVLCGHERGVREFERATEEFGLQGKVAIHPVLAYHLNPWKDSSSFFQDVRKICDLLLQQAVHDTLFWVHNPTIGKNPALTEALKIASKKAEEKGLPCRFLYHIHDFPESGRFGNLAFLERCHSGRGAASLYPDGGNVGFACLNRTDFESLKTCGAPEERVFFLPNAIPLTGSTKSGKSRHEVAGCLRAFAKREGYRFEEDWPWWVMPIRMIRRKNVLEALLLSAASGERQVLVTLDANSEPEYPYSNAVKDVVRRENLPAVLCFGHELIGKAFSLSDLISLSESVISTSLMEGFGFAFLEGPMRGSGLAGRDLPGVTRDFYAAGLPTGHLYEKFFVPLPEPARRALEAGSLAFAKESVGEAGISKRRAEEYTQEAKKLYRGENVDFGDLDLQVQLSLVPGVKDPGFLKEIRELNPGKWEPGEAPQGLKERIEGEFGPRRHAERIREIFSVLFTQVPREPIAPDLGRRLREIFFTPERHRPLLRD